MGFVRPAYAAVGQGRIGVVFEQKGTGTVLRYSGLKAWDASGRILPTRLALYEGTPTRPAWVVDDVPVTVDPTFTEDVKLTAGDGAAGDNFGVAAISGDTVVVGAYNDTAVGVGQGSAYVLPAPGRGR